MDTFLVFHAIFLKHMFDELTNVFFGCETNSISRLLHQQQDSIDWLLNFGKQKNFTYPSFEKANMICLENGNLSSKQPGLVASPDPGVASSIPAQSATFLEINHEIISMVIQLLPLIQEGLLSVSSENMCTRYWLAA